MLLEALRCYCIESTLSSIEGLRGFKREQNPSLCKQG